MHCKSQIINSDKVNVKILHQKTRQTFVWHSVNMNIYWGIDINIVHVAVTYSSLQRVIKNIQVAINKRTHMYI